MHYKRILLKLSGGALADSQDHGISLNRLNHYTQEIQQIHQHGFEIAILIGGGNFYRGKEGKKLGLKHVQSDQIGMLATLMNALALVDKLQQAGIPTKLMSRLQIPHIAMHYHVGEAMKWLSKGHVLVLGGGTGVPCFTTDSAAALNAIELKTDVLLKGTYVDGVYDRDPILSPNNPDNTYHSSLSLKKALDKNLKVLDTIAMTLCLQHKMPIWVYNATVSGRLLQVLQQKKMGTILYP